MCWCNCRNIKPGPKNYLTSSVMSAQSVLFMMCCENLSSQEDSIPLMPLPFWECTAEFHFHSALADTFT